jgi:metal-sulfur cluster biosynthetic enzyme
MENELKKSIVELLENVTDVELLDLIYKLLIESALSLI